MGKGLKNILSFIFYSNLFIAVCGFCFTLFSVAVLDFYPRSDAPWYCLLVSLSVFFIYGLQRIVLILKMMRNKESVPDSLSVRDVWMIQNMKTLIAMNLVAACGIVFFVFYIDCKLILYFLPLLVICILYFSGPFALKKIPGMKAFIIAFVWTAVSVEIPRLFFRQAETHYTNLWWDLSQFLFIAALCVPFDIRDYGDDLKNNIRSLPVVIGVRNAKILSVILLLIYPLAIFLTKGIPIELFYGTILSALCGILVVLFSNTRRGDFYYSFFADGMLIFQELAVIACVVVLRAAGT
ncbi:MAG: UbiA family prenyltransferase [Bacteroidia bacterium]|nr:UbiA family prenyltransferase [Bacteroidia bacterium]